MSDSSREKMICEQVQKRLAAALVANTLADEILHSHLHLGVCSDCRRTMQTLSAMAQEIKSDPQRIPAPEARIQAELCARVRPRPHDRQGRSSMTQELKNLFLRRVPVYQAALASLMLLAIVGGSWYAAPRLTTRSKPSVFSRVGPVVVTDSVSFDSQYAFNDLGTGSTVREDSSLLKFIVTVF